MGKAKSKSKKFMFKILIGLTILLGAIINHSIEAFSEETIWDNVPVKGLVQEKGLANYSDEEFKKAPIRITVFSATWCTYCKELKEEFPKKIYSKYDKDTVAIRVWEIDEKEVIDYFQRFTDKNQIPVEVKSQIPFIFVNEKYPYLGYSKEITSNILEDIEAILNNRQPVNGGNINKDNKSSYSKAEDEITHKEKIQKAMKTGQVDEVLFLLAGAKDNFKFVQLIVFSLLFFYLLKFTKTKEILIGAIYFGSILIFNELSANSILPELLNFEYVQTIKIGLYILFGIIVGELLINFILSGKKDYNNSKIVLKIINIFNSKAIMIIYFISGFFLMNSQVYSEKTYYLLIINNMQEHYGLLDKSYIAFLYSLGIILANIILIWIVKAVLKISKGLSHNFKF